MKESDLKALEKIDEDVLKNALFVAITTNGLECVRNLAPAPTKEDVSVALLQIPDGLLYLMYKLVDVLLYRDKYEETIYQRAFSIFLTLLIRESSTFDEAVFDKYGLPYYGR